MTMAVGGGKETNKKKSQGENTIDRIGGTGETIHYKHKLVRQSPTFQIKPGERGPGEASHLQREVDHFKGAFKPPPQARVAGGGREE